MQLTVRDVARFLNVTENAVYRWISDGDLPAEQVGGQYRFNRAELLEWASVRKLAVSPALFQRGDAGPEQPRLDEALAAGGVHHDVPGHDRESVLRAVLERIPLPEDLERELLLEVFLSREALGSTALGDGLAIPHPRYPVVLPVPRPVIALAFPAQPVPFAARDGKPVHTLFALVCPTVRVHLQLLARLACGLRDPGFRAAVDQRRPAAEVLAAARRLEDTLHVADVPNPPESA
jgi:PTS system nitrogen regulatory IIA component